MALKLTKIAASVYSGNPGDTVLLGISVAKVAEGTPATILAITYNGTTIKKAPFQFPVAAGDHGLVVVSVSVPGTMIHIDEVDSANPNNRQTLAKQRFDPTDPAAVILIQA